MAQRQNDPFTTLSVRQSLVRDRLEKLRPYDSMSWHEFIEEMAEVYEREEVER